MANGNLEAAYELEESLGRGAFGVVVKARRKEDGEVCACKRVPLAGLSKDLRSKALQEAHLLSELKSPYILRYLDSYLEADELFIITQFCDGGSLQQLIELYPQDVGLGEATTRRLAAQIVLGLEHLHARCILHRDVKPSNIFLLKGGGALLGDLGVAKVLPAKSDHAKTFIGSPAYMSPEVVDNRPYAQAADIWSLGIVVYQMCVARRPFEAASVPALCAKILECKLPLLPGSYSTELRNMTTSCLRRVPSRRPDAKELLCAAPLRTDVLRLCSVATEQQQQEKAAPAAAGSLMPLRLGSPRVQSSPLRLSPAVMRFHPRPRRPLQRSASDDGRVSNLKAASPTASSPRACMQRSGSCSEMSSQVKQTHDAVIAALSKREASMEEQNKNDRDADDVTIRPVSPVSQNESKCAESCPRQAQIPSVGYNVAIHLKEALLSGDEESTMRPESMSSESVPQSSSPASESVKCLQETLLAHGSRSPFTQSVDNGDACLNHLPARAKRSFSDGSLPTHRMPEHHVRRRAFSRPPIPARGYRHDDQYVFAGAGIVNSELRNASVALPVECSQEPEPEDMVSDPPAVLEGTTTLFAITAEDSLAVSCSTTNSMSLGSKFDATVKSTHSIEIDTALHALCDDAVAVKVKPGASSASVYAECRSPGSENKDDASKACFEVAQKGDAALGECLVEAVAEPPDSCVSLESTLASPTSVAIEIAACGEPSENGEQANKAGPEVRATPCSALPLQQAFPQRPLLSPTAMSVRGSHQSACSPQVTPSSAASRTSGYPLHSPGDRLRRPSNQAASRNAGLRGYVAKAQEGWSRWRRERLEARAMETKRVSAAAACSVVKSPLVARHSVVAEAADTLEVVGVPPPRTPVSQKRAARGSLAAARTLYNPPPRRTKGARV